MALGRTCLLGLPWTYLFEGGLTYQLIINNHRNWHLKWRNILRFLHIVSEQNLSRNSQSQKQRHQAMRRGDSCWRLWNHFHGLIIIIMNSKSKQWWCLSTNLEIMNLDIHIPSVEHGGIPSWSSLIFPDLWRCSEATSYDGEELSLRLAGYIHDGQYLPPMPENDGDTDTGAANSRSPGADPRTKPDDAADRNSIVVDLDKLKQSKSWMLQSLCNAQGWTTRFSSTRGIPCSRSRNQHCLHYGPRWAHFYFNTS